MAAGTFEVLRVDEQATGLNDPASVDHVIEKSLRQPEGDGAVRSYHACTRGFVVDGILRRTDPKGRGIVQFVEEEVCSQLGIEHYKIAVPESEQHKFNFGLLSAPTMFQVYMVRTDCALWLAFMSLRRGRTR